MTYSTAGLLDCRARPPARVGGCGGAGKCQPCELGLIPRGTLRGWLLSQRGGVCGTGSRWDLDWERGVPSNRRRPTFPLWLRLRGSWAGYFRWSHGPEVCLLPV